MNKQSLMSRYASVLVIIFLGFFSQGAFSSEEEFWSGVSEVFYNTPCSGASAGAGNAWVADESCNPALLSLETETSASAMYHVNRFSNGTDIHAHAESFTQPMPFGGAVQLNYYDAFSNHSDSNDDAIGRFAIKGSPYFGVGYGSTVANDICLTGDRLDIGVGYAYIPEMNVITNKTQDGYVEEKSSEHMFTVGVAYQPTPEVTVGAMYSHLQDTSETIIHPNRVRTPSQSIQRQARVGAAVQVTETTKAKLDLQYLDLGDNVTHKQIFTGVERKFSENSPITVRAGWSSNGPTGGIGYEVNESVAVDVAYGSTPIRDFNSTGKSRDAITVSVSVAF